MLDTEGLGKLDILNSAYAIANTKAKVEDSAAKTADNVIIIARMVQKAMTEDYEKVLKS